MIAAHFTDELFAEDTQLVAVGAGKRHPRALLGQRGRNGGADPAACARDERVHSLK